MAQGLARHVRGAVAEAPVGVVEEVVVAAARVEAVEVVAVGQRVETQSISRQAFKL
jgi:hypothetical protein